MRVLALPGSLRHGSYNTGLLRAAQALAPAGVELELYDGLAALPPYVQDEEAEPGASVRDLRTRIAAADAVLVATPEYNSSIPGQLKNALDWVSRPFKENPLRNKTVAVVGASPGAYGAMWAQADLRRVLARIGARVVETELAVAHVHDRFDDEGRLTDEDVRGRLAGLLRDLVDAASPVGVAS
jgi:chromate reductase